jgi:Leucine-rich repeat (LRR) protein
MKSKFPVSSAFVILWMVPSGHAADGPQTGVLQRIEALGGHIARGADGSVVEVSLARSWARDRDVERLAEIKSIRRLDLSHNYVTDAGIESLRPLQQLEELTLDTAEFITDAAISHLRAHKKLRKLVLRGTDITDVSLPYIAELTALQSLDLSFTMVNDVGLESLPALTELEELNLGGSRITGINLGFLKLLPKLKKLAFNGIQRRNGGACWTPTIGDLDMDTIAALSNLEELSLGIGVSLGRTGVPAGGGNCRLTGGIQISDLGLAKLAKLKKLRVLDLSGARLTPRGLKALESLSQLERLSLWHIKALDDSAADALTFLPNLVSLDISYTSAGDATLERLAALPGLKRLYLTDTKVTAEGAASFRKRKPECFVSWAQRPQPDQQAARPARRGEAQ